MRIRIPITCYVLLSPLRLPVQLLTVSFQLLRMRGQIPLERRAMPLDSHLDRRLVYQGPERPALPGQQRRLALLLPPLPPARLSPLLVACTLIPQVVACRSIPLPPVARPQTSCRRSSYQTLEHMLRRRARPPRLTKRTKISSCLRMSTRMATSCLP